MRGLARIAGQAGDGAMRVTMAQNIVLAYVPVGALQRVYGALSRLGLARGGADEISDVVTCPGAYSCNLALTKIHGAGRRAGGRRPQVRRPAGPAALRSRSAAARIPAASTGSAIWASTAIPARSTGREVPYYLMLLGGGSQAWIRPGGAELPARLAPVAVERILDHYQANHQEGETFRAYVMRTQGRTFQGTHRRSGEAHGRSRRCFTTGATTWTSRCKLGRGECAV